MSRRATRHPAIFTLQRCLRTAALPALAAAVVAFTLAMWTEPMVASAAAATGARAPWLSLPIFVCAFSCAITTVLFWPLLAARRPGSDWLRRLQRGPLHGCGAALSGALLASLLVCAPLCTVYAAALGAPSIARTHTLVPAPAEPLLSAKRPQLHFALAAPLLGNELRLRPLASLPEGPLRASRVRVMADGAPLATTTAEFDQTGQIVRIPFASRTISALELVLEEGTVPLFFPTGSVELIGANEQSGLANGLFLALLAQIPLFVALAFACLAGAVAALPTVLAVAVGVLFVMTVGGEGPLTAALQGRLQGHWLLTTSVFRQCVPSLLLGSTAMIGAMMLRRRSRR